MVNFDPVYTPFSTNEVSKIIVTDPEICLADKRDGALPASLNRCDRLSYELAAHSFVDCVEYGLNMRLDQITKTHKKRRATVGLGLDWICSNEDGWEALLTSEFVRCNMAELNSELQMDMTEYRMISQMLGSVHEFSFALFMLSFWTRCFYRCNDIVLGQLSFETEFERDLGRRTKLNQNHLHDIGSWSFLKSVEHRVDFVNMPVAA